MKINLATVLTQLNGEPFTTDSAHPDVSFKSILVKSALYESPEDKLSPEQKFSRYELATRINSSTDSVEIKVEEISILKKNASKCFNIEAYGAICNAIETTPYKDNVTDIK